MDIFDNTYLDPKLQVTEEVKFTRFKICTACEHYAPPTCLKCNCVIGMLTAYTFKSCPIGKW